MARNPNPLPTVRGLAVIPITWDPDSITRIIIIIRWIVITGIDRRRGKKENWRTNKYPKMASRMSTPS